MRLFKHQETGIQYLYDRTRAYLGDPPGFGKTRIAIHAAAFVKGARPMVVCPAIVRTHWEREFARWAPHLTPRIFSYDAIVRGGYELMGELLLDFEAPNLLILDEAHYLKHPTSQRTNFILGKNGYARRMERVWALSGTPTPKNNPMEYWTILSSLFPEVALGIGIDTPAKWQEATCHTYARMVHGVLTTKVVGIKNPDLVRAVLGETMLRRTVDELEFSMPPVFKQLLPLDLRESIPNPEGYAGYITDDLADDIRIRRLHDPEMSRYRRKVGEAKVAPALEMLKSQLAGGDEKVVVFAHHHSVLAALREGLSGFGVAYIDGDVGQPARATEIDRFQNDPDCRVFLGQTTACHVGITLTAAHRVVLVEPDWTDEVNNQAAARVARIGQTKAFCIAQYISAAGTLDDAIIQSLAREGGRGEVMYGKA